MAARSGERLGDGADQRPVVVVQCGLPVLATEHGELVAEDDDLHVLGAADLTARRANDARKRYKMRYTPLRIGGYPPRSTPASEFRAPTGYLKTPRTIPSKMT